MYRDMEQYIRSCIQCQTCKVARRRPNVPPDAETTAKIFVDEVICKHGRPDSLLSDLGSNFMSKLMQEVLLMMNTKSLKTTAYHPRTNGLVERFNCTPMYIYARNTLQCHRG
jgi:transposase InsO family protein